MPDTNPQGCLAAILSLFGIRFRGPSSAADQSPYRQRDDFLSAAELSFYQVLTLGLDGSYLVGPKVNLADIFFVSGSPKKQSYRNKIDRKHVGFLLCDPAAMKPIMGVELDDASHARRDRQDRDEFVDQVFEAAGVPLLRVRTAAGYSPQALPTLFDRPLQVVETQRRRSHIRMALQRAASADHRWCFALRRKVVRRGRVLGGQTTQGVVRPCRPDAWTISHQ